LTTKLKEAFAGLVARHESLRTIFETVDDRPHQKVLQTVNFSIEEHLLTESIHARVEKFIRPFDLASGPLFRVGLLTASGNEHILMVDIHHIVSDGISRGILIKDFMSLYRNEVPQPLQWQYKDYALLQQTSSFQQKTEQQKNFWMNQFSEEPAVLALPIDFSRPLVNTYKGATLQFEIDSEMTSELRALAHREGATMFMIMLTAYNILLSKLTAQEDIVVGVPVSGRLNTDFENVIGMFLNMLPVRNYPTSQVSFNAFLQDVKSRTLACLQHQSYPYETLIDDLNVKRDSSRNPLFDVMLSFQNGDEPVLAIPELQVSRYPINQTVSKFDITLTVTDSGNVIHCVVEYATELFKENSIRRFIQYFKNILSSAIVDSAVAISSIELIPELEKIQLLHEFNDTALDYQRDTTIVSLFEAQASRRPDHTAIVFGEKRISFRELNATANFITKHIREHGNIKTGDFVGIMAERTDGMVAGMLGIMKAGGAYVPIDKSYPVARKSYILKDSGVKMLIVDSDIDEDLEFSGTVISLQELKVQYEANPPLAAGPDDLCYLIYTSGSTGEPKGVMISHGNVTNFFAGMTSKLPVTDDDCMLAVTSTSFDISVLEIFWTLCQGVEIVIHPSDAALNGLDRYLGKESLHMDFSLFFFSSYNNQTQEKYDLLLDSVKYADEAGFKAVWTPERHFHEFGGLYPNPAVISSALAPSLFDAEALYHHCMMLSG
jgi:hypothetical protein